MIIDGIFGDLFDFDGNGKLDDFEKSVEFAMFMTAVENQEKESDEDAFFGHSLSEDDGDEEDEDDFWSMEDDFESSDDD